MGLWRESVCARQYFCMLLISSCSCLPGSKCVSNPEWAHELSIGRKDYGETTLLCYPTLTSACSPTPGSSGMWVWKIFHSFPGLCLAPISATWAWVSEYMFSVWGFMSFQRLIWTFGLQKFLRVLWTHVSFLGSLRKKVQWFSSPAAHLPS